MYRCSHRDQKKCVRADFFISLINMVAYGRRRAVVPYRRRAGRNFGSAGVYRAVADAIRSRVTKRMLQRKRWTPPVSKRPAKRTYTGMRSKPTSVVRKYHTTGTYGRRFARVKRQLSSKYEKYGFIEHVETGNVQNSNNCVYVGHSFGWRKLMCAVAGGIIRKLAAKAGYSLRSMLDKVQENENVTFTQSPMNLNFSYKSDSKLVQVVNNISIVADARWMDVVDALLSAWYNIVIAGAEDLILLRVWISGKDGVGDILQFKQASMDLDGLLIDLYCTSEMTIQNRTLARTGTADESNMLDVANNPVAGKCYFGSGNGAQMRVDNNTAPKAESFIGDQFTGRIFFNPDLGGGTNTDETRAVLNRPPTKAAFTNVSKVGGAMLRPGEMKKSKIALSRKMYLHTFINHMFKNLDDGVTAHFCSVGSFKIFAFEKQCNTGVDEPSISVGYEINNVYRCTVNEIQKGINILQTQL